MVVIVQPPLEFTAALGLETKRDQPNRLVPSGRECNSAGLRCRGSDDFGEVARSAPHGPVSRGEVDDVDVFEIRDLGKHGVTCLDQFRYLLARD